MPAAYALSITTDRGHGGIANSLLAYSKALRLNGIHHKVLLPADAAVIGPLRKLENVNVISYPYPLLKILLFCRLRFPPGLNRLISGASIIFLHNSKLLKWQRYPERTYFFCHSGKFRYLNYARNIIFLSEKAKQRFEQTKDGQRANVKRLVIGHGFEDIDKPVHKAVNRDKITIISGGRFVEKKRFRDLIAAGEILDRENINFEIVIYGQGPLQTALQQQIDRLRLDSIKLLPWSDNLNALFQNSDIFCLPSAEEPFGLILGEAMLCELPAVATDTDGPASMLTTESDEQCGGLIYPVGDVDRLAELLLLLCRDKPLRLRLGKQAREQILDHFSLHSLATRIKQLPELE